MKRWLIVLTLLWSCSVFAEQPVFFEQVYATKTEALEKSFSNAEGFTQKTITLTAEQKKQLEEQLGWKISENHFDIYEVFSKDQELIGYGVILDEKGKYHPITFLTAMTTEFKVKSKEIKP